MLHINDLTFRFGGRMLFDQATAHIAAGQRVGLVGRNGTGKTTLLGLITGERHPDGGSVSVRGGARIGRLSQEAPDGEASLLQTVLQADTEREALLAEAETATDPHRIGEIHTRLAEIGAHAAPARAGTILAGLGFDAATQARPLSNFSGGWRMRVALAAILFAEPDLLLLDEPTNHLDLEASLWLQGYLRSYPRTVILVSHDREVLNNTVERILHLEAGKLVSYSGGYDSFERIRRERNERLAKMQVKQEEERKRLQAFVDRFRAKASKARQAQSRVKMLEKMQPIVSVVEEDMPRFSFPQPETLPPPLIAMNKATVGYDNTPILRRLDLRIDQDDRIALLGPNGNGKSTLIKLLGGRLEPLDGEMRCTSKLRIGYFAQHQADELDLNGTPVTHMAALLRDLPETKVRAHLGAFGFPQAKADTKVGSLSGGEKARLLFALMTRDAPHLLLLDEPTNHLDIDSRQILVEALNAYEGAVVMVSHDPHLIAASADRLWLVADGTCQAYEGDLDDYRKLLAEQRRGLSGAPTAEMGGNGEAGKGSGETGGSRKDQRRSAANKRAALAPHRKAVQTAEKKVAEWSAQKAQLDEALADPALYEGPADKVSKLQREQGAAVAALEAAEEAWMEAQEALEKAEAEWEEGEGN